jgi:hypothetical protein
VRKKELFARAIAKRREERSPKGSFPVKPDAYVDVRESSRKRVREHANEQHFVAIPLAAFCELYAQRQKR